jgi:hypothetical protein
MTRHPGRVTGLDSGHPRCRVRWYGHPGWQRYPDASSCELRPSPGCASPSPIPAIRVPMSRIWRRYGHSVGIGRQKAWSYQAHTHLRSGRNLVGRTVSTAAKSPICVEHARWVLKRGIRTSDPGPPRRSRFASNSAHAHTTVPAHEACRRASRADRS